MLRGISKIISTDHQQDLFLPDYRIRKSNRAKYIRINVIPGSGIEIVVPKRSSIKQAKHFLQQNLHWVNQQLKQYNHLNSPALPEQIHLLASNEIWQPGYNSNTNSKNTITEHDFSLSLNCTTDNTQAFKKLLCQWLRKKARHYFPQWLDQTSETIGIEYNKLSIRSQKTRWGSCTAAGNISLNDRLLFLPFETVQYVMIHELCHIKHLNHSKRYWATVEKHCPEHRKHEILLKQAYANIPGWSL